MIPQGTEDKSKPVMFGHRKVGPRVCIVDAEQHVRPLLIEAMEDIGFISSECVQVDDLAGIIDRHPPDLLVLGPSEGGARSIGIFRMLAARRFAGKILLLGPSDCRAVAAMQDLGAELGLAVLPSLATPVSDSSLRESVAPLLRVGEPAASPVDVAEALSAGWLTLWYQPKFDLRTLRACGAEALVRIRHPTWGLVPPAYFIPDDGDPHFRQLSEFVIHQAIEDWRYFADTHGAIELAINLPIDFLRDPDCVRDLCRHTPDHPAFDGLIVEVNGTEILRDLNLMRDVARELRFHDIAISIDDLGAEWSAFTDTTHFPFAEIKVDRKFVAGCAEDRLKQTICRRILQLANSVGARTVAEGVETRADLLCVREMGFDTIQGFLSGKPMPVRKLARTVLARRATVMQ